MSALAETSVDALQRRMQAPDYHFWRERVEATGGCTHPVRLSGMWQVQDATSGTVLTSRAGHVFAPCGNRRESVCPACSDRYAADAFHLLRAGLSGGSKGVPEHVTEKPRLFLTLTAPTFGAVHNRRTKGGKLVPCRCGTYHHEADPRIGQPIDPEGYDYTGHVLWQAHTGQLWQYFRVALSRHLARAAGLRTREIDQHVRISYAKVAEYQRRGIIHFHAVIRLDGPQGAGDAAPAWATTEVLTDAIHAAHAATRLRTPEVDGIRRELVWGEQIDTRPIRAAKAHQVEDDHGEITDDRLASYVAKYATKGTGKSEAADRPIRSQGHINQLQVNPHHKRIIQTAWDLGAPVPCPDCHPRGEHQPDGCGCEHAQYCRTCGNGGVVSRTVRGQRLGLIDGCREHPLDALKLRRWAHMLAFRGHFLSKSQRYSVAFQQIRDDRRRYRLNAELDALGVTEETVTVINHWDMTSVGHRTPEERELARAIAERQREQRKYHQQRRE